jgi:GT2 family glycosyltransferase
LLTRCLEPVVTDVPWVGGFALFIRRGLWEQVGGFDRNLPDYGNEVELCGRVAQEGYRRVWVRNSYIHHFGGQSYRGTIGNKGIGTRIQASKIYIRQKSDRRSHQNV